MRRLICLVAIWGLSLGVSPLLADTSNPMADPSSSQGAYRNASPRDLSAQSNSLAMGGEGFDGFQPPHTHGHNH